jgi:protein-S-isoprenylcysteine O-methyltransferase Ste14
MTIVPFDALDCLRLAVGICWRLTDLGNSLAPGWLDPDQVVRGAWIVFLAYWFISAFGRGRAQKREPWGERLVHVFCLAAAAFLMNYSEPWFGVLNRRFVFGKWAAEAGAALTIAGIAFAIWARRHLGKNWSAAVMIQSGHELIRTGPYARLRHPIYTGMLLALVGTALEIGKYRALAALGIFLIGFARKAKKEEELLAEKFGTAFEEHKRLTGFFLPRVSQSR